MATVILLRHGRTTANASGVLAGRTAGVRLDDTGHEQVARAGERIAAVPLAAIVSSPLERCRQTARAVLTAQRQRASSRDGAATLEIGRESGITECDYGDWQGRALKDLAKEGLWTTVQSQPSAAAFPGGESLLAMQWRAVAAVRRHDAAVEAAHGPDAVWLAVSHGDVIKSILADALGMHLDLFQRLHVDPASVSIVRYTPTRPFVLASNTHAGDLSWLAPSAGSDKGSATSSRRSRSGTDAAVGGGAGPEPASARP